MDIQNRLYMAFIGVDEPPIWPVLLSRRAAIPDFALFLSQKTHVEETY